MPTCGHVGTDNEPVVHDKRARRRPSDGPDPGRARGAAVVASIVLAVSQGTDVGFFLASAVMTLALTLWLIGVIALGVRIGMHRD